jgi:hypothetical protein
MVLTHCTYAEKLTVMFSAPGKEQGIFARPALQQAQGQELENCETVSYFVARRTGAQRFRANPTQRIQKTGIGF